MTRAVLVALLCATQLEAQEPPATSHQPPANHRSGLWVELGWGPGATRIGCAGCSDVRFTPGNTGIFRIGGTITDKVLLGFESMGLLNEKFGFTDGDTSIVSENNNFTAVVLWFPWRSGVFLKGGVGVSHGTYTVNPDTGSAIRTSGTGVGITLGLGYDRPISRKLAISLNAAAHITAIGDIKVSGTFVDDVIATVYQLGLGVTFR